MKMGEIVCGPSCQQLSERHCSQPLMFAALGKIGGLKIEASENGNILSTHSREFVEELFQRFAAAFGFLRKTVKRIEWNRIAVFEDATGARKPVGPFADDEVSDNIERAPGIGTFVGVGPSFG